MRKNMRKMSRARFLLYLSCLVALASAGNASQNKLGINIYGKDGTFQILLSDKLWFNSGPVAVHYENQWLTTDVGTLQFRSATKSRGEDAWGSFEATEILWRTPRNQTYEFYTVTKQYEDEPVIVFEHHFHEGITNGAVDGVKDETMSIFPSLLMEDMGLQRGCMTYSGNQVTHTTVDTWGPKTSLPKGDDGGLPLVIFDSELANTVVISPMTGFMVSSQSVFQPSSAKVPAFGLGIMSTINTIPRDYVYKSVMVAGENVTDTMEQWGKLLRKWYGKTDYARKYDLTVNFLGYWTDNGACYYYTPGTYQDYSKAMSAVRHNSSVPFQYLQIDSWWYFKGPNDGVKNWTAMPDIFPGNLSGVRNLYKAIDGWPLAAHNRYWSSNTDYAQQNGGEFEFVIDGSYALPNDPAFWHYLLSNAKKEWNLIVYEQDWLDNEFTGLKELETDLFLGRQWLVDMGEAAGELGITIQYCMSWPRHMMQSVEIEAVSQVRVSDDYHPGNSQWKIGDSTILAHSLGLAAFKDTFHTVTTEPSSSKCRFVSSEPFPALQTYISSLSGGPVGPSDSVGQANKTLLMATCMSNGRLLKPSRPALSVDSSFIFRAFKKDGPDGEVYVAYTKVSFWAWYYVLAAELMTDYNLTSRELPYVQNGGDVSSPDTASVRGYAFRYTLSGDIIESKQVVVDQKLTQQVNLELKKGDFQYWVIAPLMFPSKFYYLGELNKIVTVSKERISGITWNSETKETVMFLKGAPNEMVEMTFSDGASLFPLKCVVMPSGEAMVSIPDGDKGGNPVCSDK